MQLSVIIPTRNRPQLLKSCIASLCESDFASGQFEIIVVNDAGNTDLADVLHPGQPAVRILRLPQRTGPGVARNAGAEAAGGQLLVFTDDDCIATPQWLSTMWRAHLTHPDAMLGGRLINAQTQYMASVANQLISDIVYAYYNADAMNARFFATNNMAVPCELFRRMGGFDATFSRASEDRDLCDRWRAANRPMIYLEDAVVSHDKVLTAISFCRQHFQYGSGAHDYHCAKVARRDSNISNEMGFHAQLPKLLWHRLRELTMKQRLACVPLMLGWQISNAAGFFYQALRQPNRKRLDIYNNVEKKPTI